MEFGGLIIELLFIYGIPLSVPIFIILLVGKFFYNGKIKKVILFILTMIYNGIVGFISPLLYFCLVLLLLEICSMKIAFLIIFFIFAIILIPINIYMIIKGKINIIFYIILNIIIFVLSFMNNINLMRGAIDL